ncbi:MAG: hypothetical protein KDH96_03710 [Candidatus Riesia sp.]|nr:hypothetical protein [Candidatus Riesia sp.]
MKFVNEFYNNSHRSSFNFSSIAMIRISLENNKVVDCAFGTRDTYEGEIYKPNVNASFNLIKYLR